MALAGIEIRYLAARLDGATQGYYTSNIYSVSAGSILFKLHHPEKPDVLLMISPQGVWSTRERIAQIEPNPLVRRLRQTLLRTRVAGIEQLGEERIVLLRLAGIDTKFTLVCELFAGGNIVLCDASMSILALLHYVDTRHRTLRVGAAYAAPPSSALCAIGAQIKDFEGVRQAGMPAAKWLGRSFGLPSRYVEKIFAEAGIGPKTPGAEIGDAEASRLHEALLRIVGRVVGGDHAAEVLAGERGATVNPVPLLEGASASDESFEDLIDEALTSEIIEAGRSSRSGDTEKRAAVLESQLAEQQSAIELVRQRAAAISAAAALLQDLAAAGVQSVGDERVAAALAPGGSEVASKRGRLYVRVAGCDVPVSAGQSLYAAASLLYDESKTQAAAEEAIEARRAKIRAELERLGSQRAAEHASVGSERVRKKAWYERYRWFTTSDGLIAVGGRDAASNASLVRRRLEADDLVFHADIAGSPFFLLKSGAGAQPASLSEAAHATACFSRAWRESIHGTDAYWVRPPQVRLAAPSGQFLPRGSFPVEGRRNLVRVPALRLAVGAAPAPGGTVVFCGPPDAVRAHSAHHVVIEPGGGSQSDAAKRVRTELARLDARYAALDLDDIARALPAGPSRTVSAGEGGLA